MHEDKYGEWTIPKGSLILANVWYVFGVEANLRG